MASLYSLLALTSLIWFSSKPSLQCSTPSPTSACSVFPECSVFLKCFPTVSFFHRVSSTHCSNIFIKTRCSGPLILLLQLLASVQKNISISLGLLFSSSVCATVLCGFISNFCQLLSYLFMASPLHHESCPSRCFSAHAIFPPSKGSTVTLLY